jgi:phage tail-like protein
VALAFVVSALFAAAAVQAPARLDRDYIPAFNFRVEIEGVDAGQFRSVSGLKCETEVIEYKDGNDPNRIRLLPGPTRCGPIVLEYGTGLNPGLWDWYSSVIEGNPVRKDGAVILLANDDTEVARWNFYQAFPIRWEGPSLESADTKGLAIEKIELAVERIQPR